MGVWVWVWVWVGVYVPLFRGRETRGERHGVKPEGEVSEHKNMGKGAAKCPRPLFSFSVNVVVVGVVVMGGREGGMDAD